MNITCSKSEHITTFGSLPSGVTFRNIKGITFLKVENGETRNAVALSNGKMFRLDPEEVVIVYPDAELVMN